MAVYMVFNLLVSKKYGIILHSFQPLALYRVWLAALLCDLPRQLGSCDPLGFDSHYSLKLPVSMSFYKNIL